MATAHIGLTIADLERMARLRMDEAARYTEAAGTLRMLAADLDRRPVTDEGEPPIEDGPAPAEPSARPRLVAHRRKDTSAHPPASRAADRPSPSRGKAKTSAVTAPASPEETARAAGGAYDDPVVRLVGNTPGIRQAEMARALKASLQTIFGVCKRLVEAKRLVRFGMDAKKEVRSLGAYVRPDNAFEVSLVVGKRKDASNSVVRRG